jgi:hypothetical protein
MELTERELIKIGTYLDVYGWYGGYGDLVEGLNEVLREVLERCANEVTRG